MGILLVVTGTGTEVGKTHLSVTLLLAAARRWPRVVGYKPVESGVVDASTSDAARLAGASTFHVKPSLPYIALQAPVSPHLAASLEGVHVRADELIAACVRARAAADLVVLELPGGLFSPFAADRLNADVVAAVAPDALVIVAPDRLGTLHDVLATFEAAKARALFPSALFLVHPAKADDATNSNATFLAPRIGVPLHTVPRAEPSVLSQQPNVVAFIAGL